MSIRSAKQGLTTDVLLRWLFNSSEFTIFKIIIRRLLPQPDREERKKRERERERDRDRDRDRERQKEIETERERQRERKGEKQRSKGMKKVFPVL